jgi:hypothetical protein
MEPQELRALAWDRAVDAHGTYEIFARRKRNLSQLTRLRDFFGFLVPILVGAVATAEWFGKYSDRARDGVTYRLGAMTGECAPVLHASLVAMARHARQV